MNPNKHDMIKIQTEIMKHSNVFASIPPVGQLENKKICAEFDEQLIRNCNEVWAFGQIGRDCSWELGFAAGLNKKIKIFIDNTNRDILKEDWMIFLNAEIIETIENK